MLLWILNEGVGGGIGGWFGENCFFFCLDESEVLGLLLIGCKYWVLDLFEIKLCICLDRDGRLGKFYLLMKLILFCFFVVLDKVVININRISLCVVMVIVDLENNDKNCKG